MKLLSFSFFMIFLNLALHGQRQLITDDNIKLNKGFYRDFYEFKYNKPSIPFDFVVDTCYQSYKSLGTKGIHMHYEITINKEQVKLFRDVFGFCDGENVYVSISRNFLRPRMSFEKIDFIGRYCLYSQIIVKKRYPVPLPTGGLIVITKDGLADFVIDLNREYFSILNQTAVEEILVNDLELLTSYNSDLNKEENMKDYIIEYSKKHKHEVLFDITEITTGEIISKLYKDSTDSTYEKYYNRLKEIIPTLREVNNIGLWESKYGNGNYRFIGLCGYHNLGLNPGYKYKIGMWRYFDKNGNLKKEVLYDLRENKIFERNI